MAQQAYQAYSQNKGTLVPGQSISVNKYTVQVERYLSQGRLVSCGFAHVYLVRTATPVYNTTHHVLKRIAVANDAMLTEVKKEVDIMRLLKGHPNIVHLIDAAWHRMPNGLYEVFILMEFCPGGGIIDMMNRRLRERLTEAEILQIFVDVCEGVAYMHNSRPALLHRDLKVENILQSSATSFKLCDFGSAIAVAPRPPATTQEIRALEADLNRHTTLQYRAPEMVDPYLRRAVDEKSDVWALGVLLYKLCYYTTPFEEHGPLAILNVQYRIPPYPVYSSQMNSLIGSMLREHGAQRPSVFELLALVHRLRGTKSQFTYTIPPPQPLSPRPQQTQFSQSSAANPLDATVTFRSQQQPSPTKANPGVQARDKVLEAIAPMRRGRPTADTASPSRSRNTSPHKERTQPIAAAAADKQPKNWLEEEDKAWKAVTVKSGTSAPNKRSVLDDAWMTRGGEGGSAPQPPPKPSKGFGDDFAEKLWDSFDPSAAKSSAHALPSTTTTLKPTTSAASPVPPPLRQPAFTGSLAAQRGAQRDKDAFEGLGALSPGDKPAPTLGEARMLRTGLAGMSSSSAFKYDGISGDYNDYRSTSSRPSPSPRPSPAYAPQSTSTPSQTLSPHPPPLKPSSSGSSWMSQAPTHLSRPGSGLDGDAAAETRFPSLEELDKTFDAPAPASANGYAGHGSRSQPALTPQKSSTPAQGETLRSTQSAYAADGVRSQQITGVAMRDAGSSRSAGAPVSSATPSSSSSRAPTDSSRPALMRRHRSSMSMKHTYNSSTDESSSPAPSRILGSTSSGLAPVFTDTHSRDWLTGDDSDEAPRTAISHTRMTTTPAATSTRTYGSSSSAAAAAAPSPVMRQSPSKRASYIEKSALHIQDPVLVQRDHVPPSPKTPSSPSTRAARVFPAIDLSAEPSEHGWGSAAAGKQREVESASSADEEGPEDANGFMGTPMNKPKSTHEVGRSKRKGRQSSVHDLVDLYGGGGGLGVVPPKEKERISPSLLDDTTPKRSVGLGTPTAHAKVSSTDTKAKRRSTGLAAVSTARPTATVAQSTLSPPNSGRPLPSPHSNNTKSTTPTTPSSARSRPQSMFLFPSKSSEAVTTSGALSPPHDAGRRGANARRTSISDMVQRYEAIGKAPASPSLSPIPPPLVAPKPATTGTTARKTSMSSQGTSASTTGSNGRAAGAASLPLPLLDPMRGARTSPTGFARQTQQQREPEPAYTARTRGASFKSRKSTMTPTIERKSTSTPIERKSTASSTEEPPERPYQGVGKLIDQWQRKTATEPDMKRPVVIPKRAVNVGTGKG
ncbi:hypothetical protein C8J57DRAFT_1160891 [Mycena rebaudengoi]|nr:hypothetical protein C8J57DRAFT_1160891 [Mycena rebaudengoi]